MAINPETQYPGKIAPSTPDYPFGSARNITTPGDGTGTPWEAALVNDVFGFQQALMDFAGVTPSGTPDKVGRSQYLDAVGRKFDFKMTEAEAIASTDLDPAGGQTIRITDRNDAKFDTVLASGGPTPDGFRVIAMVGVPTVVAVLRVGPTANVKMFGAPGGVGVDSYPAIQAATDYVQNVLAGGVVYFPNGFYDQLTGNVKQIAGTGVIFRGNGRASILQNNVSGHTLELGDGIASSNDCGVEYLMLINGNAGGAAIKTNKRTNCSVNECVIQSSGVGGLGVQMVEGWGSSISKNTFQATKGFGIHVDQTHNVWITGNRMDGNASVAAIGVFVENVSSPTITGNVIEGHGGCEVYIGVQCRAAAINHNYFEDGGDIGLTFTGGEARTIKSSIIFNGAAFPNISAANPVQGASVEVNYFNPLNSSCDSSIYLIGTEGFSEKGNRVQQAYNVAGASFIKTKNDSMFYNNVGAVMGNSSIQGFPTDRYFDIENLNLASENNFSEQMLKTIRIDPNTAPRFDAHKIINPQSYEIIGASTNTIAAEVATSRYKGVQSFDLTRSGAGGSHFYGKAILEQDFEDFWDGELWVAFLEVKAITNTPGFEMFVDVDGQRILSGGGSATTTSFSPRTIVFKPVAAADIVVGYRMTGGTGADVVRVTRPVVCPLGALVDLNIEDIHALRTIPDGENTPSVRNGNGDTFIKLGSSVLNDFDDGQVGDTIHIKAADNFSVANNAAIKLAGSQTYTMAPGDTLTLTMFDDQVWDEVGRKQASNQTYAPTNVATDRAFDANATTTEELADVLGTLIADLQAKDLLG